MILSETTTIALLLLSIVETVSSGNAISCAACSGTTSITQCRHSVVCPSGSCYLKMYKIKETHNSLLSWLTSGPSIYGGCASSTCSVPTTSLDGHLDYYYLTCTSCCHENNLCNLELCDQKVYPPTPPPTTKRTTTPMPTTTKKTTPLPTTTTTTTPTTTTTATTTTTTPTTTTTSTTTTISAPVLTTQATQMECAVCTGSLCGLTPSSDPIRKCPNSTPYCMNTVEIQSSGRKSVSKKCASETACNNKWWMDTVCVSYHPQTNYTFSFTCSYCCTSPRCNIHMFPDIPNLYIGSSNTPLVG